MFLDCRKRADVEALPAEGARSQEDPAMGVFLCIACRPWECVIYPGKVPHVRGVGGRDFDFQEFVVWDGGAGGTGVWSWVWLYVSAF